MPYVLCRITRRNWDKDKVYADYPWLEPNLIPAACLTDFNAKSNELSLWYVEGEDDPNRKSICVALAATRQYLSHLEYALFDTTSIERANFVLHETPGQTPDESITHLHRDLKELSMPKLVRFLEIVWDDVKTGIESKKEIEKLIRNGIQSGRLKRNLVNHALLKKFDLEVSDALGNFPL